MFKGWWDLQWLSFHNHCWVCSCRNVKLGQNLPHLRTTILCHYYCFTGHSSIYVIPLFFSTLLTVLPGVCVFVCLLQGWGYSWLSGGLRSISIVTVDLREKVQDPLSNLATAVTSTCLRNINTFPLSELYVFRYFRPQTDELTDLLLACLIS